MKRIIDVPTGEISLGGTDSVLVAAGIGSCIALGAWNPILRVGGLAHLMLPGYAPADVARPWRYMENGITELLSRMRISHCAIADLAFWAAGAGNVLMHSDDMVCAGNIASLGACIERYHLRLVASSLGGTCRRRVEFDIEAGRFCCAEGDGPVRPLLALHDTASLARAAG